MLLLNTPDEYPFRDIESWPHINGVFYVTEEENRVVESLQGILRGECYFRKSWPATLSRTPEITATTVQSQHC